MHEAIGRDIVEVVDLVELIGERECIITVLPAHPIRVVCWHSTLPNVLKILNLIDHFFTGAFVGFVGLSVSYSYYEFW